jgi:D-sedoheptulose 7-phosphate isomerase
MNISKDKGVILMGFNSIETLERQIELAKMSQAKSMIKRWIRASIRLKEDLWRADWMQGQIYAVAMEIARAFQDDKKVLSCGCGGSSSDSAHFCGEFNNQLSAKRTDPLPAVDLSAMTATMTAISNDHGFDEVFKKQVKGLGKRGDVFVGISTSGKSRSILTAIEAARNAGLTTVLLTGKFKTRYTYDKRVSYHYKPVEVIIRPDYIINVDSEDTPIIQETHIMILHMIVNLVDYIMCGVDYFDKETW